MGLDMYLTKKTYVRRWEHGPPDKQFTVTVEQGGKLYPHIKSARVTYVTELVAYWRKANAIHKWFVDHVQGGKDDCREYDVSREQLAQLVSACKGVLDSIETVEGKVSTGETWYPDGRVEQHTKDGPVVTNVAMAAAILPTQSGFFFGSTHYDEFYIQDLRDTVEEIEPLLSEKGDGYFYYRASW